MRWFPLLPLALALTACGEDARTAGGVSKAQADALDKAAATIEQSRSLPEPLPSSPDPAPSG